MNVFFLFDIAAIITFGTLLVTTIFRQTVKGYANKLFIIDLCICIAATLFRNIYFGIINLASVNSVSLFWAYFCLYCFFILQTFILPVTVVYIYASRGILSIYKSNIWIRFFMQVFTYAPVVYLLSNLITGRLFSIEGNWHYVSTAYIYPVYLCAFGVIFIGCYSLIHYRKAGTKTGTIMGLHIYGILLLFLFYQHLYPEHEITAFIVAMCFYLISSTTMRPELMLNLTVHSGVANAFYEEVKRNYDFSKSTDYLLIKIIDYKSIQLYIGHNNYNKFLNYIADCLENICKKNQLNTIPYYLNDGLFAISIDSTVVKKLPLITVELEAILHNPISIEEFDVNSNARIVVVDTPEDISTYEYFVDFAKNFHHLLPKLSKTIYLKDFKNSTDFKLKNDIERIMEIALEKDSFEVYYHPIYSVAKNKFISGEALLRLNNDYFGNISPSVFIPVAEKNGMIYRIGDVVFEKVFQFVSSDTFKYLGLDNIEINLSVSQCTERNLVEKVETLLDKYKVSPDKIRFEITENAVDVNPEIVEANIRSLSSLGIRFTLDDYGTGYSNIKKVLSLPIDIVKLDKNFIQDIDDEKLNIIINDTIEMLKNLHKNILVEGIENKRTMEYFTDLKFNNQQAVEYIQGYYFSRPLPEKDFVEFIRKG